MEYVNLDAQVGDLSGVLDPTQRKARREYENRVNALLAATAGP
ncbi:hypothetical protein OG562_44315 [Streptomyces sp. NBC_01275]|nr:hypothetical protein [Streptomyces sp. NBC_01275]MCX4767858.1 hypothetical protein [Streptomyces sp. NBC_01275]